MHKNEWNLKLLFDSDDDPAIESYRNEIKQKVDSFADKWSKREDYLVEPEVLRQAIDDYAALDIVGPGGGDGSATKDAFYFWLRSQQDQNDVNIKAKEGKALDFANSLFNSIRFFRIGIMKIKPEHHKLFLESSHLKDYKHFIERAFAEAKHTLEVKEESILALKSEPSHSKWTKMVSGFLAKEEREVVDEDGNTKVKNFSEIVALLSNPIKEVRDSAAKAFNNILTKNLDVAEAEINAILTNKKIDDELRGFTRPDSARHLEDDIETEVVDTMIDAVTKRFDIPQRYYLLKSKLMGVKKMQYHERNVMYGTADKSYSYEETVKLIEKTFTNLDKEFAEIFNRLKDNGQIDVFPRKGKKAGAFCTDSLLYQPTYVLLNHCNKLSDVNTVAHEFGHAINAELMKENCNTLYAGMSLATAEVASTFMEDFVVDEILKEADEEMRLSLMMFTLNDCVTSISRQVACYRFEQELHKTFKEKGYLSKEEIGTIFRKHMASYMGEAVEQSSGSENWWVYWSHIRRFFYVYSYASGLLISKSLQSKVRNDKSFISKVKKFLGSGMSNTSKNIFLELGIDISDQSFWEAGLEEIDKLLVEAEALAKKLGKI